MTAVISVTEFGPLSAVGGGGGGFRDGGGGGGGDGISVRKGASPLLPGPIPTGSGGADPTNGSARRISRASPASRPMIVPTKFTLRDNGGPNGVLLRSASAALSGPSCTSPARMGPPVPLLVLAEEEDDEKENASTTRGPAATWPGTEYTTRIPERGSGAGMKSCRAASRAAAICAAASAAESGGGEGGGAPPAPAAPPLPLPLLLLLLFIARRAPAAGMRAVTEETNVATLLAMVGGGAEPV